jgi:hypothetical protein
MPNSRADEKAAQHQEAQNIVLMHYHALQKDLILRHKDSGCGYPEIRALAAQLTIAATMQVQALQTARLADAQREEMNRMDRLRKGFVGGDG